MDIWIAAILLVALLIGWLLGRWSKGRDADSSADPSRVNCSEHYIQGLNYLLANKSDKAIELFVDLVKVDKETMETHLALGNLFRSKGEVDRAIKIHQNLIARPNLDPNQRVMSLTELAEDYLKAGLLDRAENLYQELVQINPKNTSALHKLLEIYSLEKSWSEAKGVAHALYDLGEPGSRLILTHCYCEMAEESMADGNLKDTRTYLDRAIQIDKSCIRALLLLIELHLRNENLKQARQLFKQLINTTPQFIELYLKPARDILLHRGSVEQYQQFLIEQYAKNAVSAVAVELLESYQNQEMHQQLLNFLRDALQRSPSMELIEFGLRYFKHRPQTADGVWPDLPNLFKTLNQKRIAYLCSACGYGGQAMHWNCPSCKSWSSIKPVH